MTDIVSRSVVVAALDEVAELRAEYAYSESALKVRLTQAMLELIGCAPLRPETDFALELHAQTLDSDGDSFSPSFPKTPPGKRMRHEAKPNAAVIAFINWNA